MDYGMACGFDRTPRGRLWASWIGGGDSDKAYLALATSDDNGDSWTEARMVIDPHDTTLPLPRRTIVGNLWTDPRGRLWLFFDQSMTFFDGRAGLWCTRCDDPDADQPQWTRPRRIWHGCALNKPIVLRDGTWLLPASLWSRRMITHPAFKENFTDLDPLRGANVLASADEGETWTRRGGVAYPEPDFDEHHFIERTDGTLWMTARTMNDGLQEALSTDGGHTWSPPRASAIRNVNSRHFIRRLASGRLLLVKHGPRAEISTSEGHCYTGRRELTAFLSDDDGRTWKGGLSIDERHPVTYPDGCQADDGLIYIAYDHERETLGHVLFARFREADILAGRAVSPDAAFKKTVFKPLKPRG
jgi:predicted neuraminidase